MRLIDKIIIHCSATSNGAPYVATDIDWWHKHRGFQRDPQARERFNPELASIGYHYVIRLEGWTESGRDLSEVGAHCQGENKHSIGICMIGTDQFTLAQWENLEFMVSGLIRTYRQATVHGHREFSPKLCPGFDVQSWVKRGFKPLEAHVYKGAV